MVYHGGGVAPAEQRIKLGAQLGCGLEASVCCNVLGEWPVQGARDVAGHWVQRLHLAAIPGGTAGVDHGLGAISVASAQAGCYGFDSGKSNQFVG